MKLFHRKSKHSVGNAPEDTSSYRNGIGSPVISPQDASPQTSYYIHSLRLYELAQNPDLMTPAEKTALQHDMSLMRTYQKYRQDFE